MTKFSPAILLLFVTLFYGCENTGGPELPPPMPVGPSDVVNLTDADFEQETAQGIVLVDFYADWCQPCRYMAPMLESFATNMKDQVKTVKINAEENPRTASAFSVQGYPTLVVLVDGKAVKNQPGALPDEAGLRNFVADVVIEHGGKKSSIEN